jgi:uncharacterized protein YdeI (YjbR/CyaY-like superfamily)
MLLRALFSFAAFVGAPRWPQRMISFPLRAPVKSTPKPLGKSFQAALERIASRLGWIIIRIPFDVFKIWGTRGQLRVKGEINGFAFRTSLFPSGKGYHYLFVNGRMQAGGHVYAGMTAQFHLEPDTKERKAILPAELKRFLDEDRSFRRWFHQLNYSTRKEIGNWITQVKSAEARLRRAEQIAERLLATMEAERELPPVLKAAFARDPRALEGWKLMSPSHRRGHLLAIFYYRSPEARDRRVAKTVQDAIAFAERKINKK